MSRRSIKNASSVFRFFSEVIEHRSLVWSVFKHNYILQHKTAILGYFWLVVNPCVPVIIYNLLQFMGIFSNNSEGVPRAIYLSLGLIIYYVFSESLTKLTSCCVSNSVFLLGGGVQKSVVISAGFLEVFSNFLIRFVLYLCLLIAYDFPVAKAVFIVPPLSFILVLLGGGIGIALSAFNVILRDVSNAVNMICFYLLFGSGVFATIEQTNLFFTLLSYSPIYLVIDYCRDAVFIGQHHISSALIGATAVSVFIFFLSLVGFYRVESKINSYL